MIAKTLRNIRLASSKTCEDAASALGITRSAYWRKEAGERPLSVDEAKALSALFGVPVEEIVLSARAVPDSTTPSEEKQI